MTLEQLLAAARQAISEGDLAKAEQYKNQAVMLRDVDALTPPAAEPVESAEVKALKAKMADLEAFKARIENEPATKSAGHVVVVKDETDKKSAQPWEDLGKFLKAIQVATQYPGQADERLKAQKAVLGASSGVPADGGYLVQPNFSNEIFSLEHATGEILPRVRKLPVGANSNGLIMNAIDETSRVNGSRWGGVQAYWAAEGDSVTASKPKFRQMEMKLNKLMALMYATDEVLNDTTLLGAIARTAVNEELTLRAEEAIFRGVGAGQPYGIFNGNALITVPKESGQATATVTSANIFKMWSRMWSRSRRNAVWFINQDIEPQLFGMEMTVGTGGVPVYLPPGGISQSPYSTLMGRPLIPIEDASTLGTVGDITLIDPTQYIMIDKGGIQEAESMHVQFLTDQMTFRWTYRLDGQPAWSSAMTPKNGTATLSPFVALATRA